MSKRGRVRVICFRALQTVLFSLKSSEAEPKGKRALYSVVWSLLIRDTQLSLRLKTAEGDRA